MPDDKVTPVAAPPVPEPTQEDEHDKDEREPERKATRDPDEELVIPMFGEDPGA